MATRRLYEGAIEVGGVDYTHTVDGDRWIDVAIEDLDTPVTSRSELRFALDYPFERRYEGRVYADGGITLRQIIDAIRAAYRHVYRDAVAEPIPDFDNQRVRGAYGQAIHVIEDLAIESIDLDNDTAQLAIYIGS